MNKKRLRLEWWIFTIGTGTWFGSYLINGGWWRLLMVGVSFVFLVVVTVRLAKASR